MMIDRQSILVCFSAAFIKHHNQKLLRGGKFIVPAHTSSSLFITKESQGKHSQQDLQQKTRLYTNDHWLMLSQPFSIVQPYLPRNCDAHSGLDLSAVIFVI